MSEILQILFLLTFYYGFCYAEVSFSIADVNDELLTAEERLIKSQFTCSYDVCKGRGRCYLNEMHKVACHCYAQYYHGANCSKITDTCDEATSKEVPWVPSCEKTHTNDCWAIFGMNYCECNKIYMDRTCSQLYDAKFFNGPVDRALRFPHSPIALFILEPTVHEPFNIEFGVVAHYDVTYYEFAIEGISYHYEKKDFTYGDVSSLKSIRQITTLLGNEFIPQKYWRHVNHFLRAEGYNRIIFQSYYVYELFRRGNIVWGQPTGKHSYSADYEFEYRSIRKPAECIPLYMFYGAACSETDSQNYYGTTYKAVLKLNHYIKPVCNKTFQLTHEQVVFDFYKGGKSMDKPLPVKIKQLAEEKNQNWKVKYETKTLKEVMIEIGGYSIESVNLGDMFMIAAQIQEIVPGEIAMTGTMKSNYGMGVCFVRYLKQVMISPSIMLGDFLYWAPFDTLNITASIMTYDTDEVQQYGPGHHAIVYQRYRAELQWKFLQVNDSFRIECFRWNYNQSDPLGYERDKTSTSAPWWKILTKSVNAALNTLKYVGSFFSSQWHYNPYYDSVTGFCFDASCPVVLTKEQKESVTNQSKYEHTEYTQSVLVNLSAPQDCNIHFIICLVQVIDKDNEWFPKYKHDKNHDIKLSPKKDCTSHTLLIETITQGIGYYLPLLTLECVLNCRGGSVYVNWEIDSYDLFMIKYNIHYRPEKLEFAEWKFQSRSLSKDLYFQRSKDDDRVIFLEPHAFDVILDSNNMVNITVWLNHRKWVANMDVFVFIREKVASKIQYCQVSTASAESVENEFLLCEHKAEPSDAQTVIYYQKMSEYVSERGLIISYGHNIKSSHNWLASSTIENHMEVLMEHDVFMSEYLTQYSQEFEIRPPRARLLGPVHHVDFLRDICFGTLEAEMSTEFDAKMNNFFHTIQKLHVIVIESVHTGFTKYLDENTLIINTKDEMKNEYRHLNELKIVTKHDALQLLSVLNEFIYIYPLPLKSNECIAYAILYEKLVISFQKIVVNDVRIRHKPYAIVNIIKPLLRVLAGIIYPAMDQLKTSMDDALAQQISSNTKDEMQSYDILYEYYDVYILDVEEYNNQVYKYGNGTMKIYTNMARVMGLMDQIISRKWEGLYFHSFIINSAGQSTILYIRTDNLTLFAGGPHHEQKRMFNGKDMLLEILEPFNTSIAKYPEVRVKVVFTEFNMFWWHETSRLCLERLVFLDIQRLVESSIKNKTKTKKKPKIDSAEPNPNDSWRRYVHEQTAAELVDLGLEPAEGALMPIPNMTKFQFEIFYEIPQVTYQYFASVAHPITDADSIELIASRFEIILHPNQFGRLFIILDDRTPIDLRIFVSLNLPTVPDFWNYSLPAGPDTGKYVVYYDLPRNEENLTLVHVLIAPNYTDGLGIPYYARMVVSDCMVWTQRKFSIKNRTTYEMTSGSKMNICDLPLYLREYDSELNDYGLLCRCYAGNTTYTMSYSTPEGRLSGFLVIELEFAMVNLMLLPGTELVLLLIFAGLFFAAYLMDRRDNRKIVPMYCITNRPDERVEYIIVCVTSSAPGAGTTSHVGIKLFGTFGNSKRHVLQGYDKDRKQLQRRSVDWFCITCDDPIGNIRAVELWIDNRGQHPSWKLEKLIVRDYFRYIEWVFMADIWFSLVKGEPVPLAHHILYQKVVKKVSIWRKLLNENDLYMYHVWYGMFVREHCHSFSRKEKVAAVFSVIFTASLYCMFIIGIDIGDSIVEFEMDFGFLRPLWAIQTGVVGLLISVAINYPLVYAVRNSNPDPHFNYYYSDFSGVDPTAPIPLYLFNYSVKFWVGVLQGFIIIGCGIGQISFALVFGTRKTFTWLICLVTIVVLDFLVAETLNIIARSFITRLFMKIPDTQRFCNDVINLYMLDQVPYANRVNVSHLLYRDMFTPMCHRVRKVLQVKERSFLALNRSIKDAIFFSLLFLNNCILYSYFYTSDAYLSTDIMESMFIRHVISGTKSFQEVDNLNEMFEFLNGTLLFSSQWSDPNFMVITNVKLVGIVRLRQLRVRPWDDFCAPPEEFEGWIIDRCDLPLTKHSTDTSNYNPGWKKFNKSLQHESLMQVLPFMHQASYETETRSKIFDYHALDGGGYIARLGRKPINTRMILNYLIKRNWVSNRTHYIFVEFLAYNVHANYFNAVTMIFHISRTGDISKSYTVDTFRAFIPSEVAVFIQIILYIFLMIQSWNIIIRHFHQIKHCLVRLQAFQDTLVMVLTITTLTSYAYRFVVSKIIIERFNLQKLNTYVSMDKLLIFEYYSKITTGLLCSQNLVHLIDLGHGTRWIRIFYFMLVYAMEYILVCVVLTCIFLISFSCAFHFIIGQDNFLYHHFWLAYVQTFAIPFANEPSIEFQYETFPTLIPYIIFTFYGYSFRFLICGMFSVVMVNSYHRARLRLAKQSFKYSLVTFVKERMFHGKIPLDNARIVSLTQEELLKRGFKPKKEDKN